MTDYDDDTDLEDELQNVTDPFVVDTLGFDPREFDEESKSLSQQVAIVLADTCGAGSPGGAGFEKGNTCQSGYGGGEDDWENEIGKEQMAATAEKGEFWEGGDGLTEEEEEMYVDHFYELEKREWQDIAKEICVDWDGDEGYVLRKYVEHRQKQQEAEETKRNKKIQKPKNAKGDLESSRREYREALKDLGMMDMSIDEVAELAGQMDGVETSVYGQEEVWDRDEDTYIQTAGISLSSENDTYQSERMITKEEGGGGETVISNNYFSVVPHMQGQGIGTRVFARQVKAAQDAGIDAIVTGAARSPDMNGYYTWPRLGYDRDLSDLPQKTRNIFHDYDSSFTKVSDIMKTQKGRDYWKENGTGLDLRFDLTKGSLSMRRLRHYLKQKGIEL